MDRQASRLLGGGLALVVVFGVCSCRSMIPPGGGAAIRPWIASDAVGSLVVRDRNGEWRPVGADLRGLPAAIEAFFDNISIELDLVSGSEPTVKVMVNAAELWASSGPEGALERRTDLTIDPTSRPVLFWGLSQLMEGLAFVCDPDGSVDGEDSDGVVDDDCGLGELLGDLAGMPCPILGDGGETACDPFKEVRDRLESIRNNFSVFTATLEDVEARWATTRLPDDDRPVLELELHFHVDLAETGDLAYYADTDMTLVFGSLFFPLRVGNRHCPAGLSGSCDLDRCDRAALPPEVHFNGFTGVPGDRRSASWTTGNLVIDPPYTTPVVSDFSWTCDPWMDYACGPLGVERDYFEAIGPDLEAAFSGVFAAVARFLPAFVSVLPAEPLDASVESAVFCDLPGPGHPGPCGFECLRNGCTWSDVLEPGTGAVLFPAGTLDRAPRTGLRLIEGAVGATRAWWNAMAGPLDELHRVTDGSRFEFVGATARCPGSFCAAVVEMESDLDCDGVPDHEDGCPTAASYALEPDSDGDTLADVCDVCEIAYRADPGALPRLSDDYFYRAVTSGLAPPPDADADGVGNHCDLCPMLGLRYGWSRNGEMSDIGTDATDVGNDEDHDGWGNDCDNCPIHANRDQWNCNAADELIRGSLRPSPTLGFFGHGDACDPYPCVDSCTAPDSHPDLLVDETYREWANAIVSPVALDPVYGDVPPAEIPADEVALVPANITTDVRGCHCTREEMDGGSASVCRTRYCPDDGTVGGDARWDPARPAPDAGEIYEYKPLYHGTFLGTRGDRTADPYFDYAAYYAVDDDDRKVTQTWEWYEDLRYGPACLHVAGCSLYVRMWFKPHVTDGTWFHDAPCTVDEVACGPYRSWEGNTYTDDFLWVSANPLELETPFAGCAPHCPPTWEKTSLVFPWAERREGGDGKNPREDVAIDVVNPDPTMSWSPQYKFDTQGTNVAGIAVSGWNTATKSFGWVLPTKLAPGPIFDLEKPAVTFAFAENGDPYRYWMFGGVDPSGMPSDQMWAAKLTTIDAYGGKVYVGGEGLSVPLRFGPQPDPTTTFYELAWVKPEVVWPSARFGATFACAGWEEPTDGDCKMNCPKPEVALGLQPPPDGITQPAGALVLVGGEGVDGPLADIWRYEEVATSIRPAGAEIGDPGPWPTGWKRTGSLPGVDGGLSAPGSVQVDRTLWLVGGRTAAGPTMEVFKVDLESGTAGRVEAAGSAPPGRVTPAVAYDSAKHRLVAFGGVDAYGRGFAETWGFDLWSNAWTLVTPACVGDACPQASGHETLRIDRPTGELTIIADRPTNGPPTASWSFREGAWVSAGERASAPGVVDCDGDTTPEALFGLRCGTGSGGFPDFGRMRCTGGGLGCRSPVVPARVVWEYAMPQMRAMVADRGELLTLHGSGVEVYTIGEGGLLSAPRVLRLRRAGHDLAAVDDVLVVADDGGVSLYARKDGTLLSRVDVCGRARRVFADGRLVYVLGLLQLTILDVSDPSAPSVLQQIRFIPGRDEELELRSTSSCSRVDRGLERLCDAIGACGLFGRAAAAFDGRRLFLSLLGVTYVLDMTEPMAPAVEGEVPSGWVKDMAVEGSFLYTNGVAHRTRVIGRQPDGTWVDAGEHDVEEWVDGVVELGDWVIRSSHGRLSVATRQ